MGQVLILREVPRSGVRLSAGLAAAETTAALALAHTAAGGVLPSTGWLLTIAATVYAASLVVLRGRLPVRVALPALLGTQVLLHAWLVTLTSGTGAHPHGGGSHGLLGLDWPMLLAHLAAGLVAAAAWVLRRRAVDVLLGWSDRPTPHVSHRGRLRTKGAIARPRQHHLASHRKRGPPWPAAAAA